MTDTEILTGLLDREGGFVHNPADTGGPTKYGITSTTLGMWRKLGRRATVAEVRALSQAEALDIYRRRYVIDPGFDRISYLPLRAQLIDFGVNSGPARAIRWLQRVLRMPPTGVLDEALLEALYFLDTQQALPIVNDALVAARLYMIEMVTDADDSQKQFEEGWEGRALHFFLARPD